MSQYITGAGSSCWGCLEDTYGAGIPVGTTTADTSLINMTSESISTTYNRLEEGTLLASKTRPAQDLSSVTVSGGISTIFKPDFAEFVFEWAMGKINENADYTWYDGYDVIEYNLADPDEDLPSAALYLNRSLPKKGTPAKPQNFLYDGLTVSSVAFDCTAQDFVKADINVNGRKEVLENADPSPAAPASSGTGSYKCTSARLIKKVAGTHNLQAWFLEDTNNKYYFDWADCPAGQVWDVSRTQFTIDNGLEEAPATYCSGLYANQPSHGQRNVTLACEVPYSQSFEDFRQQYYANTNPDNLALLLAFCTKDEHNETINGTTVKVPDHQVFIIIPNVNIDGADANVSGQGLINSNFTGTALSIGNVEPLKVIKADYTGV